jgi:four helix bundle protein
MRDFKTLYVWQKAHRLVLGAYAASATLTAAREFDLRRQLLRAAVSVPANVAEGCGRIGDRELGRYCGIALGSASELEYHLLLARDLGFFTDTVYTPLAAQAVEVKRMLAGFISSLQENEQTKDLTADS